MVGSLEGGQMKDDVGDNRDSKRTGGKNMF